MGILRIKELDQQLRRRTDRINQLERHNAELSAICEELLESAEYWCEYDVPAGIVDRMNMVVASCKY